MTFIAWDNSLDTGVESMNTEHKNLIILMEKLHTINEKSHLKPILLNH